MGKKLPVQPKKLALIPLDVKVGELEKNLELHKTAITHAVKQGASFLIFPELSLSAYPTQDLFLREDFRSKVDEVLADLHKWLQEHHPKIAVVVGAPITVESKSHSAKGLANGAIFFHGKQKEIRAKTLIPFYDVFHENRYFDSAADLPESYRAPIEYCSQKIGLLICEDSWHEMKWQNKKIYSLNPTEYLKNQGCTLLVNLSASPYSRDKKDARRATIQEAAQKYKLPIAYVNHFGAQDELLFDGDAFLFGSKGELLAEKAQANDEILYVKFDEEKAVVSKKYADANLRDLKTMLVAGIRGYVRKNGFDRVVLGLSGGIDSALVAALAVEALGPKKVVGLAMPSKYSSSHSIEDAELLARNLGLEFHHLPIKMMHSTFGLAFKPFFETEGLTEENLQSRLRGICVMAFANQMKGLALATGNKSEFAMGYSTLYGDMCGALAPIGDLLKTEVYELSRYINQEREVIPERTLTKAPSAELRPNQTDQDSLPPYDLLDAALQLLVVEERSPESALSELKKAFPKANLALLERIHRTLCLTEFKRNQAPPILRISRRAFGRGRLYPLTCSF